MQISYTTLRFLLRRNEKENVDASRDEKDLHHTIHRDMSKYDKSDKRYKHFQKEDMEMLDIFWRMFSCRECEFYKNYPKCHRNFGSITHIDETTTVGQVKIGEFVHEMRYTEFPPEEAIKMAKQAGYLADNFVIGGQCVCKEAVRLGYVPENFFDEDYSHVIGIFKYMNECDDETFKKEFKGCLREPGTNAVSHIPESCKYKNFDLGQWVKEMRESSD